MVIITRKAFLITFFLLFACEHQPVRKDFVVGMTPSYQGNIPVRIAVFPCQIWQAAKISPLHSCKKVDAFILSGFKDQPLMKGYTQELVMKMLQNAKLDSAFADVAFIFAKSMENPLSEQEVAEDVHDIRAIYENRVQNRADWQEWLSKIRAATHFSDAFFLPYVEENSEEQRFYLGIPHSTRTMIVSALLLDSENGQIIWAGRKGATFSNKVFSEEGNEQFAPYPKWEELDKLIFCEAFWNDFPGRKL